MEPHVLGREYITIHKFAVMLIKMRLIHNHYYAMYVYAAISDTPPALL